MCLRRDPSIELCRRCSRRSTRSSSASPCTARAARCSKRRPQPLDCRCGSCRCRGPVRTRSMSSAWPRLASAHLANASTRSRSAICFWPMCAPIASGSSRPPALSRFFRCGRFRPTQLAREMIAGGLRARLSCVDTEAIAGFFAGREFDAASAARLARRQPIRAASAASFTPASMPGPCSTPPCRSKRAKSSNVTASSTPTFSARTKSPHFRMLVELFRRCFRQSNFRRRGQCVRRIPTIDHKLPLRRTAYPHLRRGS